MWQWKLGPSEAGWQLLLHSIELALCNLNLIFPAYEMSCAYLVCERRPLFVVACHHSLYALLHTRTHVHTHTHTHTHSLPPQNAISDMISKLPLTTQQDISGDTIEQFAFHVLNESCTTVTNTSAKTAVQLVFGKANLVHGIAIKLTSRDLPFFCTVMVTSIVLSV